MTAKSASDCENLFRSIFYLWQRAENYQPEDHPPSPGRENTAATAFGNALSKLHLGAKGDLTSLDSWNAIWGVYGHVKKKTLVVSSMPYFLPEEEGGEGGDNNSGGDEGGHEDSSESLLAYKDNRKGKVWASSTLYSRVYMARRYTNGVVLVGHVLAKVSPPSSAQVAGISNVCMYRKRTG